MSDEQPITEIITLSSAGAIPGLPGSHGPGTYEVDWATRTIKRIVDGVAVEEAVTEEEKGEPAPVAQEPSPTPEAPPTTEVVFLPSGGAIPGLPGHHGPGTYQVDWLSRTVKRLVDGVPVEEPIEVGEEAPAESGPSDVAPVAEAPPVELAPEPAPEPAASEGAQPAPEVVPEELPAPPAPEPLPEPEPVPAEAPTPSEEEPPAAPDEASEQA